MDIYTTTNNNNNNNNDNNNNNGNNNNNKNNNNNNCKIQNAYKAPWTDFFNLFNIPTKYERT